MKKYAQICNKRETLSLDATININWHMDKGGQGQTHKNTRTRQHIHQFALNPSNRPQDIAPDGWES